MSDTFDRPVPGDIIAVDTGPGTAYVQITHLRAPYPDVLRAIHPVAGTGPEEIAKGNTAFVAMVELARALADPCIETRIIGHATIPPADRAFPCFVCPFVTRQVMWSTGGHGMAMLSPWRPTRVGPICRSVKSCPWMISANA